MSSILSILIFLACGLLMTVGFTAMAHLFVQDYINRHEREHHRRSGDRTQTTAAGE